MVYPFSIESNHRTDPSLDKLDNHLSQNGGFGRDYVVENKGKVNENIEEFITVEDFTR